MTQNQNRISFENIIKSGNNLEFINNDPQIFVEFEEAISLFSLYIELEDTIKSSHFVIYYSSEGIYSENEKIEFDVFNTNEIIRYIVLPKRVKYVRIDPTDENIKVSLKKFIIKEVDKKMSKEEFFKSYYIDKINNVPLCKNEMLSFLDKNESFIELSILRDEYNKYSYVDGVENNYQVRLLEILMDNNIKTIYFDSNSINKEFMFKEYGFTNITEIDKDISDNDVKSVQKYSDYVVLDNDYTKEKYSFFSDKIISKDKVNMQLELIIEPKYNLYIWENSSRKHFFDNQNEYISPKKREKAIKISNIKNKFFKNKLDVSKIVLLDTSIGSDNIGDNIIMDYCKNICVETITTNDYIHIPTHIYDPKIEN